MVAASPVLAFQKFEQYRILGSEILSVRLGPLEHEAPATMYISTGTGQEIMIESDGALDDCKGSVEEIIGNRHAYIEISVHVSADTMNGVMLTGCSVLYGLHFPE